MHTAAAAAAAAAAAHWASLYVTNRSSDQLLPGPMALLGGCHGQAGDGDN